MNKKWSLYNISLARQVLMGFATLIVVIFHCYSLRFGNSGVGRVLKFLRLTGNVGVDIFLLLSAIGLYFSFSKNNDLREFYKKRLIRILPTFLIIASIYYLYRHVSVVNFFKNITFISFYLDGNRDFWYIAFIIIMYLLYPILHKVISKYDLLGLLCLIVLSVVSTILVFKFNYELYSKIEIALTRVLVFLIGIYIGKKVYSKDSIPNYILVIFGILLILINLILYNYHFKYYMCVRYIYGFLAISWVFILSYLYSVLKIKFLDRVISFVGLYSMEVYLIFEKLALEIKKLIKINNHVIFYILIFFITLGVSILIKKFINLFMIKKENNVN